MIRADFMKDDVCPRCSSANVEYKEQYYCVVCKNCGLTFKNI